MGNIAPTEYLFRGDDGFPLLSLTADDENVYVGVADGDGTFVFRALTATETRRAQAELPVFLGAALAEHENH